jgi:hypothetical protein
VLEQAVYAGRNHTAILAVALATSAMLASPARADDVARVGLGNQIRSLLATADGGAAITIQRVGQTAIGRAGADGSFRTASANGLVGTGAIGPDGEAAGERVVNAAHACTLRA